MAFSKVLIFLIYFSLINANEEIKELKQLINSLTVKINHLENDMKILKESDCQSDLNQIEAKLTKVEENIETNKIAILGKNGSVTNPIIFGAYSNKKAGTGYMKFKKIYTNVGNAMDIQSGTFTCPVSG